MIESTKRNQMMDGKFVCATFVSCIHGLLCAKITGNISLCVVMIFAQIPYLLGVTKGIHLQSS